MLDLIHMLLAQVGYAGGRWVGRRQALAIMKTYHKVLISMDTKEFADFLEGRETEGRTDVEIAEELDVPIRELRVGWRAVRDARQ